MKSIKASKNRTAARQDIMESYEEINRNIQSSRDAILEAHATPQDIRESCDEMKQSIKQSHDAILEAQVTRRPSPPPSILLNGPKKPRKRKGAHDIRVTSALHRRKPSWQGSIGLVKAFTQLCGSKSREVFRSATKSAHPRSASEGVLPLQRTFFQHGAGTRLHPIDEQNAVDTMAGRLLGQDYQSSRHKAYISELPNSKNRLRKRPGDDKVRAAFSLSSQEIFIASKRRHCQELIGQDRKRTKVNYSLSSLCLWKISFIIKDYTGNTTTVIQHTRGVIGVVINEDTDGCVANTGDLLFDVHFATVGKDRRVMVSTMPPSIKRAHAQGSRYR
ncbi:hypothetical protein KCU89_g14715, partial [Aureobasidium melanogenum]